MNRTTVRRSNIAILSFSARWQCQPQSARPAQLRRPQEGTDSNWLDHCCHRLELYWEQPLGESQPMTREISLEARHAM